MPHFLEKEIKAFLLDTAEVAKLTEQELRTYQERLNAYQDIKNSIDTAREEGRIEGMIEAKAKIKTKVEIAKKLLARGIDVDMILEITGLTKEEFVETQK